MIKRLGLFTNLVNMQSIFKLINEETLDHDITTMDASYIWQTNCFRVIRDYPACELLKSVGQASLKTANAGYT